VVYSSSLKKEKIQKLPSDLLMDVGLFDIKTRRNVQEWYVNLNATVAVVVQFSKYDGCSLLFTYFE